MSVMEKKKGYPSLCQRRGLRGFSLVELLVTLGVSGILAVVLMSGFLSQKRTYEGEAELRDMQMKAQLAMNQIKQYIRNAGLGCEENFKNGSAVLQGANQDFSNVFTVTPRDDGPDTLSVITGFRSRGRIVCASGSCVSNTIEVTQPDSFDTGSGRYLFAAPAIENRFLQVTTIMEPQLTLSGTITVHHDDPVYRVNAYTVTLDTDGAGSNLDVDGDGSISDGDNNNRPDLYIYDNRVDLADETLCKVAEGIEDIQFQYLWDTDGNGRIEGAEWTWKDDPSGNLGRIRAVRIWVLVRSLLPDPNYEDIHEQDGQPKAYAVADHLIQLDANDENGIDSHFDHRFHRHLCVESILIRNRSL